MTKKARTKQCHCGKTITERYADSEKDWGTRAYCSKKCQRVQPSIIQNIIDMHIYGNSTDKISSLYGVGKTTIRRILREKCIVRKKGCQAPDNIRSLVIENYRKDKSIIRAGEMCGVKYHSARVILIEAGELVPHKKLIAPHIKSGIIQEAKKNKTTKAILNWGLAKKHCS